jgi:multidrug efflux pump subunit AcrA (membrane-fusion protein)
MKKWLKLILLTLPIALAGVAFLAYTVANRPTPQQNPLAERVTSVRVIVAKTREISPQATGFGLVRPARTYEAIAQVGAVADYVNPALEKGAILPAGAVLVRLSPADFNLAIAQARANIRAARAKLAELDVSQANLEASLEIEQAALALASDDLARVEKLANAGTMSKAALGTSRAAQLAQRQKMLSVQNALALLPTQRQVQTEQIAVYQANLETATLNLERTTLTLPFAARVAARSVEVGQFVGPGQVAARLDGVDAAEIEAQVSVADMRALLRPSLAGDQGGAPRPLYLQADDLGLRANVRLQVGQGSFEWPATVDRLSDTIDQKTGTLGVIVRVADAYSGAKPGQRPPLTKGMFVQVTLRAAPVAGIVVPRAAVRNGRLLLADDSDRLAMVPVQIQFVTGDFAVIQGDVPTGARVVVSALNPAIAGMALAPVKDSALMARLVGSAK